MSSTESLNAPSRSAHAEQDLEPADESYDAVNAAVGLNAIA